MSDVTDADREWAANLWARCRDRTALVLIPEIATALAEERERERERSQWNPMVGRVIQVAQQMSAEASPAIRHYADRINRAIEGDQ